MYPESTQTSRRRRRRTRQPRWGSPRPLAILLLAINAITSCGDAPAADAPADARAAHGGTRSITVTDLSGRTVRLDRPAGRVIGLTPAINEWIVAMGAGHRLVARTDYDDAPALQDLPSVGGGLDPSIEWLAARQPDLVVAWPDGPSRSLVQRLTALGIPVYTAPIQTVDEALGVARDLGRLLGREAAAAEAVAEVRAGLDSIRTAVKDLAAPSVLFVIGLDPLMAAGQGTFADELIRRAGGRNALGDVPVLWPHLALEEVVRRAPDVVLIASNAVTDPIAALDGRPGWTRLPAVRGGRVYALDPDRVARPGPRLDEVAARLAELIHGRP